MSKQVKMTVYNFYELSESKRDCIREGMAARFLHKYMDGELENYPDLRLKVSACTQDTTFKTIRDGIKRLASEEVEEACMAQWYLDDGKIVTGHVADD